MFLRVVLATCFCLASFPANPPEAGSVSEGVQLFGLDADPRRTFEAERVIERFAEIGLDLPDLIVEFHDMTAPCKGHDGLIRYTEPTPTISICSARPYVLPHEFAHAWVDANVGAEAKAAYVERWNLASWNDSEHDWSDRGTEHAAFAIQQNLNASPAHLSTTWLERAEAFEEITGIPSPLR